MLAIIKFAAEAARQERLATALRPRRPPPNYDELKGRIWFTLGVLVVYRLGTYVPIPGIDPSILAEIFQQDQSGILGVFDVFAGGALGRMALFALNVMPYISASIIIHLMTTVSPRLEQLKNGGEDGRKKINQYTRYLTVLLAALQAYGIAVGLEGATGSQGSAIIDAGYFFRATTVITLVGGAVFLMWLGEQIAARGIGNGIALIIMAGIVAQLPGAVVGTLELGRTGALSTLFILFLIVMVTAVIAFIVFMERAQRRIILFYPERQVGDKILRGQSLYLRLKLNTAGVIPPIFASSLLLLPITLANFAAGQGPDWLIAMTAMLGRGQPLSLALYIGAIVFFCFYYSAVMFNPADTAEHLKKYGGYIPGFRPGKNTAEYLDYVQTRLTVVGAGYVAIVCLLPEILLARYEAPFYFGGVVLLIVVTVIMHIVAQVQSHLLAISTRT